MNYGIAFTPLVPTIVLWIALAAIVAIAALLLLGLGYYGYTYSTDGRFTNMGMLLFMTSLLVFLIGLVSEQITSLIYQGRRE